MQSIVKIIAPSNQQVKFTIVHTEQFPVGTEKVAYSPLRCGTQLFRQYGGSTLIVQVVSIPTSTRLLSMHTV